MPRARARPAPSLRPARFRARARSRRSRIHGIGLFATADIKKGGKIIEYTGERITKAESERRYDAQMAAGRIYLFDLNARYDVDGAARGNDARFANHSCAANAESVIDRGRIWIEALRPIQKGDEVTYDYNMPVYDHKKRPCRCGAATCRGYIVSRASYRYLLAKKAKARAKGR